MGGGEKIKAERPKLTVHILIATGCTTQEKEAKKSQTE
jgi:hypothetical protein